MIRYLILLILLISPAHECSALDVQLQWEPTPEVIQGYRVYYKEANSRMPFNGTGATQGVSPVEVGNLPQATLSGLDPSKTYYFAVTAYNADRQESGFSNLVVVTGSTPTGDINDDGVVTVVDALLAKKIAVGKVTALPGEVSRGDVAPLSNGVPTPNDVIDAGDVVVILAIAVGNLAL